jgi:Flp pilus assembly protein TadD
MKLRATIGFLAAACLFQPVAAQASDMTDFPIIAAAIKSGRLYQAALMLDRTAAPADDSERLALLRLRADLALASGENDAALRAFRYLETAEPGDCDALRGKGLAAVRMQLLDEAIAALEPVTRDCPPDGRSWDALAIAYAAQQRWDASAAAHDQALALAPDNPSVLNNRAMVLLAQRRYADALPYLQRAHAAAPGEARIANNLDIARASSGTEPVRDPADDAHRWAERLNNAGYAALVAGRTSDARRLLTAALEADPRFADRAAASLLLIGARH